MRARNEGWNEEAHVVGCGMGLGSERPLVFERASV